MSQDHHVWIGPAGTDTYLVMMTDKVIHPITKEHHLEPMRGSAYTLAVFDRDEWDNFAKHDVLDVPPDPIGYTTVHALGMCNVQSVKEWVAKTNYKWEGAT